MWGNRSYNHVCEGCGFSSKKSRCGKCPGARMRYIGDKKRSEAVLSLSNERRVEYLSIMPAFEDMWCPQPDDMKWENLRRWKLADAYLAKHQRLPGRFAGFGKYDEPLDLPGQRRRMKRCSRRTKEKAIRLADLRKNAIAQGRTGVRFYA